MEVLLKHIGKYVQLSSTEQQRLSEIVTVHQLKKKDFLLSAGDYCQYNYFVAKGCLRMYFIKDNGNEQITQFAIENWWLTDTMSLLTGNQTPFFIQAIEDVEVLALDVKAADALFLKYPNLERYYRLMMQYGYASHQFRMMYLYDQSREESYRVFSTQFPSFVQRIPQYMLASFLGITPEYLSELRKRL